MTSKSSIFEFPAPILKQDHGMRYHFMPIPDDIARSLMESGTRRVILSVNGVEENRAIHTSSETPFFFVIGLPILRRMGIKLGDMVLAKVYSDPEPDKIDVPQELHEAFSIDEGASVRFKNMTPGMQRSIVSYVTSVKRPDSRVKRAMDIAYKMSSYTLHGDQPQQN